MAQAMPTNASSTWNVNSWHWEEKNYTSHAKEYLHNQLSDLTVDAQPVTIHFNNTKNFDGDVYTNIRKGKKIVGYDFKLDLQWSASTEGGETVTGSVHLPEVSTEVDGGQYEFQVSLNASKAEEDVKQLIKKAVQTKGKEAVFAKINDYINALKGAAERSW
jgi:activator of HSP90 ATPase